MSEWARPDELDVFATGDTLLLAPDDAPEPSALGEAVRRAARDYHARPGYRPGVQIATTSGRRNGLTDIVRPVLIDPRRAGAAATEGSLFATPVPGFDLDPIERGDADYLVWHARLSGDHVRSVPVSLQLLATPSMAVTVIELTPRRRVRWNRDGFVIDGVAVTEHVAARLRLLAAQPTDS